MWVDVVSYIVLEVLWRSINPLGCKARVKYSCLAFMLVEKGFLNLFNLVNLRGGLRKDKTKITFVKRKASERGRTPSNVFIMRLRQLQMAPLVLDNSLLCFSQLLNFCSVFQNETVFIPDKYCHLFTSYGASLIHPQFSNFFQQI